MTIVKSKAKMQLPRSRWRMGLPYALAKAQVNQDNFADDRGAPGHQHRSLVPRRERH
jgi:hypothetical protein